MNRHKLVLTLALFVLIQTCVLSTALGASASSDADSWVMFRHDPAHSGTAIGNQSFDSAKLQWTHKTDRGVQSSPAVANGLLVVGCRDTQVYCLNASTGEAIWQLAFQAEVWSSPAIDEKYVYVGTDDGYVYWINITNGFPLWRTFIGGPVRSSPALADGCIYIGSGSHDLYCLNMTNGDVLWKFPTSYRIFTSPAVSGGVVFFGCDDYYLWAVNATDGKELWHIQTSSVLSSPSVYNSNVVVGSIDGYVICLNTTNGAEIWRYQTEGQIDSSPAIAYGHVYFGSYDNNLYCLDAASGEKIWQSPTKYWITASPTVAGGNVFVGSNDQGIYCFDAFTGERKWRYETGNIIESTPTVVNGTLYVGSDDHSIYAFTLCDSTIGNVTNQDNNTLNVNTIAFDVTACVIIAGTVSAFILVVKKNRKEKPSTPLNNKTLPQSWISTHKDAVYVLGILAFSIVFFIFLGNGPLWAADEKVYSQWAFHMYKTGDYWTPWGFGENNFWIAKPPLFMWLISISYQLFGASNFSTRIISPIFGILSLVTVFYLGKMLYNQKVGFISAIVLGTFTTFFVFTRHAMIDVAFVFFITAGIYFILVSEKSENPNQYTALSGAFFGLALMTKQIQGFVLPLIIIFYFLVTKKSLRFLFSKRFALFLGVGLLIFLPWVIYMMLQYGSLFNDWYFMYSGLARAIIPIEGHNGGVFYYLTYLVTSENPIWIALLPVSIGLCAFYAITKHSKNDTLLLSWIVTVLGLFTFAQTKLYWYILPAFPAFAVIISVFLYKLSNKVQQKRNRKKAKTTFELQCNSKQSQVS